MKFFKEATKDVLKSSKFCYFPPNRTVIKEDHFPEAMYIIMEGEVALSEDFYDKLEQKNLTRNLGTLRVGEMFGQVSLSRDIPRTATATTKSIYLTFSLVY